MNRRSRGLALVTLVMVVTLGCQRGPKLGTVTGTVTFEGKPLEKATVTFTPMDGQTSFARTAVDGTYELRFADGRAGAMLGENAVSISTYRPDINAQGDVIEHPEILPAKYHMDSELARVVEPGSQVFDFQLTK